mmetsp:Transcript_836/g.1741  ORF Transcript_836/g.1741 Transcript_836/m.1741 type:complete len:318 (-) Transcript_836:189-1142(-)
MDPYFHRSSPPPPPQPPPSPWRMRSTNPSWSMLDEMFDAVFDDSFIWGPFGGRIFSPFASSIMSPFSTRQSSSRRTRRSPFRFRMDTPFVPSPFVPPSPSPFFPSFSPLQNEIRAMMQQQQQQANVNLQLLLDEAERLLNNDPACIEAMGGGGPLRLGRVYSQSTSYVSSSSIMVPEQNHRSPGRQRRTQQCRKVKVAVLTQGGGDVGGATLQIVETDQGIYDMVLQLEDGRQIQVKGSIASSPQGAASRRRTAGGPHSSNINDEDNNLPPDVIDAEIVTDEMEQEEDEEALQEEELQQQNPQQNRWSFPFQWTKGV